MTGEDSLLVNARWFWIGRLGSGPLTDLEIHSFDGLFPKPKIVQWCMTLTDMGLTENTGFTEKVLQQSFSYSI